MDSGSSERVVRGEEASAFNNSTSFTGIPGASTTVSVPRGEKGLILARYSAETICYIVEGTTNTGDDKCSVRIMVEKITPSRCKRWRRAPATSSPTSPSTARVEARKPYLPEESHSMDRSRIVGPGTYTVKAQWAVTHTDVTDVRFRVDDWSLTVEKARVS